MSEPEKKKPHPWRAFIVMPKKENFRNLPLNIPYTTGITKKNKAK